MSLALRAPGPRQVRPSANITLISSSSCVRIPAPASNPGAVASPYLGLSSRSRSCAVIVFARKEDRESKHEHDNAWAVERAGYIERERMLLEELAATRALVGRMLDQQQMLVQTIAQLSTGGAAALTAMPAPLAAVAAPATPTARTPAAAAAAAPGSPASSSSAAAAAAWAPGSPKAAGASSSSSSSSGDVPAPNSIADLFRKAATSASNNPAGAAAAAAIAAAVAAVDSRDILTAPADSLVSPGAATAATAGGVKLTQPPVVFGTSGIVEKEEEEQAAASGGSDAVADGPVERPKASPEDAPPDLVIGDDDIFWMSKLHAALEERGFHPGDFDMENWVFGETTLNAVLTFQASERLPETGVVDRPTWTALLGAEEADELFSRAPAAASAPTAPPAPATASSSSSSSSRGVTDARGPGSSSGGGSTEPLTRWPVLMEGEGGREVHALQVALSNCGYYPGEDDMRWWQFGDTTLTALKFFQSCNGLPESGVCDERTWRSLMSQCVPEAEAPQPNDIYGLRMSRGGDGGSDDEDNFDDDMEAASNGRVWLLGEQRWEKR